MTTHPCERITDLGFYDTAKERFEFVVDLPCSADRLFAIFEDAEAWPRWATDIVRVDWTSPKPFRAGTTRTVLAKRGLVVGEEFLVWEHGRTMAFCFTSATQKLWTRFGERYEVTELGAAKCRLTWTIAYEPRGVLAWMHPWIRPLMRRSLRGFADNLVAYAANHGA